MIELHAANGKFLPAHAEIEGDTVEVFSDKVSPPAVVCYGWANVPDVNLFNQDGFQSRRFEQPFDFFAFPPDIQYKEQGYDQ